MTDICEKTKNASFLLNPSPPPPSPKTNMYVLYAGQVFSGDEIHTHLCMHSLQWLVLVLVSIACSWSRAQDSSMTRITHLAACCTSKTKVACRPLGWTTVLGCNVGCGGASGNLTKVLRIKAWRKCRASIARLDVVDESAAHFEPAAHRYVFKKRTCPKPPLPLTTRFVFSQISLITDGPLINVTTASTYLNDRAIV